MDKVTNFNMLYDFYGELLTEKQKYFFELYYLNDLSLSEIAQEVGITPQGVSDLLKRTEKLLWQYEEKLHLVDIYERQDARLQKLLSYLDKMQQDGEGTISIMDIRERINQLFG